MVSAMPIAPYAVVDSPPWWAAEQTLLQAAAEVIETGADDNRWEMGFEFCPPPCATPSAWFPNCVVVDEGGPDEATVTGGRVEKCDPASRPDCVVFEPFTVDAAFSCNASSHLSVDHVAEARDLLDRTTAKSLENQFWNGTVAEAAGVTQMRLAMPGATTLNADPSTPIAGSKALPYLIQAAANCGAGGRRVIHAPAAVAAAWTNHGALQLQDGTLRTTVGGHVVVPGQGYTGTGPNGEAPDPGQAWVYVTSPVVVYLGEVLVLTDAPGVLRRSGGRPENVIEVRAERQAAAVFDPCCHLAALIEIGC